MVALVLALTAVRLDLKQCADSRLGDSTLVAILMGDETRQMRQLLYYVIIVIVCAVCKHV